MGFLGQRRGNPFYVPQTDFPMSLLNELSNLHIFLPCIEKSLAFPGPRLVRSDEVAEIELLLEAVGTPKGDKFSFEYAGTRWRGQYDYPVDGRWLVLRRLPMTPPSLDNLPSPIRASVIRALLAPEIGKGGLIHIVGGPGCGKTTTAAATVVSRLREGGGICTTIEDPDEMKLNGWHGKGYCAQHCIDDDWAESMKRALRCQPSGAKLMMYVGEVRDAEAARTMLRAANNGFLVISTGFGADIVSGIDDFQKRLPPDERGQLANALRLIVYQHLDSESQTLRVQMLRSDPQSATAGHIRSGSLNALIDEIKYQERNEDFD